jgi:molybdopterin-containing oxidoreductase family iron-sulfur binding subunit
MSPATAAKFGISYRIGTTGGEHGAIDADVVEMSFQGRTLRGPAWILPGHADNCVTLDLGYGRTRAGKVGSNIGFNAFALLPHRRVCKAQDCASGKPAIRIRSPARNSII